VKDGQIDEEVRRGQLVDQQADITAGRLAGKLHGMEQIEQTRALKQANRLKTHELSKEGPKRDHQEIKRLKKENNQHHRDIQNIKSKSPRASDKNVQALKALLQEQ